MPLVLVFLANTHTHNAEVRHAQNSSLSKLDMKPSKSGIYINIKSLTFYGHLISDYFIENEDIDKQ